MISIADEMLAITEAVRDLSDRALSLSGQLAQLAERIAMQIVKDPVPVVPLCDGQHVPARPEGRPDTPLEIGK